MSLFGRIKNFNNEQNKRFRLGRSLGLSHRSARRFARWKPKASTSAFYSAKYYKQTK